MADSIVRIKVLGAGGGGGNAINDMITAGVAGVEFIAANTDAQDLDKSLADVSPPDFCTLRPLHIGTSSPLYLRTSVLTPHCISLYILLI